MTTTVVNLHKTDEYDVRITRPSLFGNPEELKFEADRPRVLEVFRAYFHDRLARDPLFRREVHALRGLVLG